MDWETATRLPWGVLILFGGGLALASATEVNGVPGYIGSLAAGFAGWPFWAVLLAIIAIMVFMSELTSNTAQVATMLPILARPGAGARHPRRACCSCRPRSRRVARS